MVEKWKLFEKKLKGTASGNPYKEIWLKAKFTNKRDYFEVNGFYCGNGQYMIRFMPNETGIWKAVTESNDELLNHISFEFECGEQSENNHGRVLPRNEVKNAKNALAWPNEDIYHFAYEDGTRFQPFGTTCYAWIHQCDEVQEKTLNSLQNSPFNKVRMCIFPKFYTYNTENPEYYPFEGNEEKGFDFARFNPHFWERLEKRITQLDELGIQADIILFHPYDKWGFSKMTREDDVFYLEYAVNRLSHFKNIWWSLANEFDLMPQKTIEDWELYARVIMKNDSYGHLRSIHNCLVMYDHTKPWITHCSIQRIDVYKTAEMVKEWREIYQKPIIVDECSYEGNMNFGWGNITGEEMTRRFWEGMMRGGYLSHGETYVDRGEQIWWSHGGTLSGDSPQRIAFLKKIMEEISEDAIPLKITPENNDANWDAPCLKKKNEFFLYYFGFSRPAFRTYELPEGFTYEIEMIDTWNMTIEKLEGTFSGSIKIEMPGRQYMAIRMKKVSL